MLAILIRHNTSEQRKTLSDARRVIDPALGDFSSLDFSEHEKAMTHRRGGRARRQPSGSPALSRAGRGVPAHRRRARRAAQ